MSEKSEFLRKHGPIVATGFSIFLFVYGVRHRVNIMEKLRYVWDFRNPLRHKRIEIVETLDDCQKIVNILKMQTAKYKVLGFDCEWVTVGGSRRPVALLQLATHQGVCALFRLCYMQQIPKALRELLEDEELLKVGVAPQDDAKKLSSDYGVGVASTFDLRFLAAMTGHKPEGLAKLSQHILFLTMDKHWRLACSDWEARILTPRQLHYAANDALVAVEIFYKLANQLQPRNFWQLRSIDFDAIRDRLEPLYDVTFKDSYATHLAAFNNNTVLTAGKIAASLPKNTNTMQQTGQQPRRTIATRTRALYDNCLLRAPDNELLCTIDRRKAEWYLHDNLGTKVCDDPFTVRLNFEPSGRAVGDVGRYYQTPKENQCVVCGRRDAFIRKNVVPREYRKYFPKVMKNHTSHDVLLLCPQCHQISDLSNLPVRERLGELCDAPFKHCDGYVKYTEDPILKKVRSAGRALAVNYAKIPQAKRDDLEKIIKEHYQVDELTEEHLTHAMNIDIRIQNENFCEHGLKVVQKYQNELGGLIELEKLWRQHFLDVMHPKYLPELWNVNHNANRLEIRAQEGRVSSQELLYAGLNIPIEERAQPPRENLPRRSN